MFTNPDKTFVPQKLNVTFHADETTETRAPQDCTECINDKHPERCRKHCSVLAKNHGYRVRVDPQST